MKLEKKQFVTRLVNVIGLNKTQSEKVYEMFLDDRLMPSHEVVKTVEVIKEVPVEVVKTVEVIKEVEVIREVPVELTREKATIQEIQVMKEKPVEVVREVNVFQPIQVHREVPVEVVREVNTVQEVEVTKEIAVPVTNEVEVFKEVSMVKEVPVTLTNTNETVKEITVIKEVAVPVYRDREVIKKVEVIKEVPVEVIKEVQVIKEVEVIKEVPVEVIKEIEVIKEVIVKEEVPVEVIKEIEKIKTVEIIKEIPVQSIKEVEVIKVVEVIKEVPVEVIVEVIKLQEVEVIKEVPVEVEKIIHKVDLVQVSKEVATPVLETVERMKLVEMTKEVSVPVETIFEKVKEVEVFKEVPIPVENRVEIIKEVEVTKELPVITNNTIESIKEVTLKVEVPVVMNHTNEVIKEVQVTRDVPVVVTNEIEVIKEIEVVQEVPVEVTNNVTKFKEVEVVKEVAKPMKETVEVIKTVSVLQEVPVTLVNTVEVLKPFEVIKEIPVTVTKDVQVTRDIIKEVPVEVIKEVEVISEIEVEVVKEVEVIKEVIKTVEIIKEVPIEVIKEVEVIREVEVIKEIPVEVIKEVQVTKEGEEISRSIVDRPNLKTYRTGKERMIRGDKKYTEKEFTTINEKLESDQVIPPTSKEKEDDYLKCSEYEGKPINDKKNNVALFKHDNGQFYFAVYNQDGSVKLRSEGFRTANERDQELSGALRLNENPDFYEVIHRGNYYMNVLHDETGREVGRSCLHKIETKTAAKSTTTVSENASATVDKEDDYLPCSNYEGKKINDKKNNVALFKHDNGQFYFAVYNQDGSVKLRSEGFRTSQERDQELSGALRLNDNPDFYTVKRRGNYYMNILHDETGREVGRSCLLKTENKTTSKPTATVTENKEDGKIFTDSTYGFLSSYLEVIEGIGPKITKVLNNAGIMTWKQVSNSTHDHLKKTLDSSGTKFKMRHIDTWPTQAGYAHAGDWTKFISFQKNLGGESKLEKMNKKTTAEQKESDVYVDSVFGLKSTNLQVIEGIGPKINEILAAKGINTWKQLSITSVSDIQKILDEAGSRFKMHNPASWPEQAALAASGEFSALIGLQKVLDGGKDENSGESDSKLEKLLIKKGKL